VPLWSVKSKTHTPAGFQARSADRHAPQEVACTLGEVLDMSATGMRLKMTRKPPVIIGQVMLLELDHPGGKLAVKGQVRWWRRAGMRRYEVGLKFVRVRPGAEHTLEAIAKGMRTARRPAASADRPVDRGSPIAARTSLPNYFAILGLRPDADEAAIKRRYRQLAARLHPDVNLDPDAMQRFERLNDAYRVLSDARRREAYLSMIA
jgi:hypothetical protein